MYKLLFLAAVAGLAISSVAQSPPPPSPTFATQNEEHHPGGERHDNGQANQPAFNQSTPHYEKRDSQGRQHQGETANETIAKFTIVLAIVGFLQVVATVVQAIYMHKGLKVTRVAAGAAQKSADAAIKAADSILITDRAIVLIHEVCFNGEELHPYSTILITLKNFGQTIAYRVKFSGQFGGLGQFPIDETPPNTVAPQGTISWMSKSINNWLQPTGLRIDQINARQAELNYRLDVTYDDAFNKSHTYRCEGKYEPALKGFIVTSSV